jgi:glycosyltransferase involved in cell wall biosynthesis
MSIIRPDQPGWFPAPASRRASANPALKVAVSVDLMRGAGAGGHLRYWERLARAASGLGQTIDLTVHVQGEAADVDVIDENVRFAAHRPVMPTSRIRGLGSVADHTDLAPHHPGLARALADADIIHTTDAFFAHAATCRRAARRDNKPLIASLHTDVPAYTRLYSGEVLRRMVPGALGRAVATGSGLPEALERHMNWKLRRHYRSCDWVLASRADHRLMARDLGAGARPLRRGIDFSVFSPTRRDRNRLAARYGISPDTTVLLTVGRVSVGKNSGLPVRVARQLLESGKDVHVIMVGRVDDRSIVENVLPPDRLTLTGPLAEDDLSVMYASADIFLFPSEIEVAPNAVQEARASGLPVLAHRRGGGGLLAPDGRDGCILDTGDIREWSRATGKLIEDADRRRMMGREARLTARRHLPEWRDVLLEDLLPVWRHAHAERVQGLYVRR